jgi:hypothetical protein
MLRRCLPLLAVALWLPSAAALAQARTDPTERWLAMSPEERTVAVARAERHAAAMMAKPPGAAGRNAAERRDADWRRRAEWHRARWHRHHDCD